MKVVFLFNEYSLHNHIVSDYLRSGKTDHVSIVKVPLVVKGKGRLESGKKIVPQMSPRFLAEKLYEFVLLSIITWTPKILPRGAVFRRLRRVAEMNQLPYFESTSVTSPACLEFIRKQEPDVIVTMMHQIVKGELLRIPKKGIVNIHPGLLPAYRGLQPYFWALSNGETRIGATLHLIEDEGIDTGAILARASFPVPARCSVSLAYYLTARAASAVLQETVSLLAADGLSPCSQQPGSGAYFRWPDRAAFHKLWSRKHTLVRMRDVFAVITGTYDNFAPDQTTIYRKHPGGGD